MLLGIRQESSDSNLLRVKARASVATGGSDGYKSNIDIEILTANLVGDFDSALIFATDRLEAALELALSRDVQLGRTTIVWPIGWAIQRSS